MFFSSMFMILNIENFDRADILPYPAEVLFALLKMELIVSKLTCFFPETQRCQTRRERLKSAPYLRLKKRKFFKIVKGGPFGLFVNLVCCKMSKK